MSLSLRPSKDTKQAFVTPNSEAPSTPQSAYQSKASVSADA